jgi:predicted TIM-barrel fold metal-dependent hydrolase
VGLLDLPMAGLDDADGDAVPPGLPEIVDAHVHLFPARLHTAIADWFDRHGWPVRYRLDAPGVIAFLKARGVRRMVALHYAHKPGIARGLNRFVAGLARAHEGVIGLGTVLPGEPDAVEIVREAFDDGLRGIKLHCHVQCFAPDAAEAAPIFALAAERGRPVVLHAGREPNSAAYKCDVDQLCAVERVEAVLRAHPTLKLCVPHLGFGEEPAYTRLLEKYDHLWLDTAMMAADYFPGGAATEARLVEMIRNHPDRIMYGTDFPNLPYAWDRELIKLARLPLTAAERAAFFGGNALALYR